MSVFLSQVVTALCFMGLVYSFRKSSFWSKMGLLLGACALCCFPPLAFFLGSYSMRVTMEGGLLWSYGSLFASFLWAIHRDKRRTPNRNMEP